jgi:DNA modification methylase
MKQERILGDCLNELKKINTDSIDLVVSDPPYWKVISEKWDYEWRTEKNYKLFPNTTESVLFIIKDSKPFIREFLKDEIAQVYNPQMGLTDVWRDIDFYSEKRFHPTQKPLKLIKRLIEASSNPNDLVLDPFGGSGSTMASCMQLNRQYITIEKDEEYYNLIKSRKQEFLNPLHCRLSL